ncbi:MAG: pyridoxamine 5'-phosphate oxidase family protein [Oscillospiraceae bacterium]|nr:pyridoxamine 5'-phosphate oxidase family protein [Oscillospiraceae bacterium]
MKNAIEKASDIIRERATFGTYNNQYCVLAQEDMDGQLTAAVITPAKSEGIKWITFCTGLDSNKAKRIARDNRAAVCFDSDSYSITLQGRLEILTDAESKHAHWYDGMGGHYSGPDDPEYCVLKFHTEKYRLFVDWEETVGTL